MKSAVKFLAAAVVLFATAQSHADECVDLKLNGDWVSEGGFLAEWEHSYRISQEGCLVLVRDQLSGATWRLDLSGAAPTSVPQEVVAHERAETGEIAAQNMAKTSITFTPELQDPDYARYVGIATIAFDVSPHAAFSFGLRGDVKARVDVSGGQRIGSDGSVNTDGGYIRILPVGVNVTNVTAGLPNSTNAASFAAGLNSAVGLLLKMPVAWEFTLLTMRKVR